MLAEMMHMTETVVPSLFWSVPFHIDNYAEDLHFHDDCDGHGVSQPVGGSNVAVGRSFRGYSDWNSMGVEITMGQQPVGDCSSGRHLTACWRALERSQHEVGRG